MPQTPVETAAHLGQRLEIDLRIKRDDFFPMSGGGNKARKIAYIVPEARRRGYDTIVTNGGVQSNHVRATALACAASELHCRILLHGDPAAAYPLTGNALLTHLAGAQVSIVPLSGLAEAMDEAVAQCRREGRHPLYLWGGGHCLEGTLAYYDAAGEFLLQCPDWKPEFVVLASGTGTTQAGLHAGFAASATQVVGISVARQAQRGATVVRESVDELAAHLGLRVDKDVIFLDEWTCGGYEQCDDRLFDILDLAARSDGLILDPTYTAKAFRGLVELVERGFIAKGSRVLFWHTGGLPNLMACPDFLRRHV